MISSSARLKKPVLISWLMMYSGQGLRQFLLNSTQIYEIVNLTGYSFENANVETVILLAKNGKADFEIKVSLNNGSEFYYSHSKKSSEFTNNEGFEFNVFNDKNSEIINFKLFKDTLPLDEIVEIKAGLQAYEKGKGEPKQSAEDVKKRPYDYLYKYDDDTHKYLEGGDVQRYSVGWSGQFLKYGKNLAAPRTIDLFNSKKIIIREITGVFPHSIISTYSEDFYLYNRSNIGIIPKKNSENNLLYILSVLNSKLIAYYFVKNTAKSVRKLFPKLILNDLRKFPFKNISPEAQQPFILKADLMLSLNKELQHLVDKFQRNMQREFGLLSLTGKLQNWHDLSYADFLRELAKAKVSLTLSQKAEWEEYFTAEKQKALNLKQQIAATDSEIDRMVYELYGLTEEEIGIVEGK